METDEEKYKNTIKHKIRLIGWLGLKFITHAIGSQCVGRVISDICDLSVLKKQLEVSTPNLVDISKWESLGMH